MYCQSSTAYELKVNYRMFSSRIKSFLFSIVRIFSNPHEDYDIKYHKYKNNFFKISHFYSFLMGKFLQFFFGSF